MLKKTILIIVASICFVSIANAQLTATWSSPTVNVGTTSVDFVVDLSGADLADTVSIGFISSFDAALSFTSCTISGSPNFLDACQLNMGGDISIGLISAIPANPIVTITFDITGIAVGTYDVQLAAASSPQYVLGATSPLTNVLSVATGTLTVNAGPTPAYTSNPATASTLTFATVLEGGTPDTQTVDITNTGDSGTTLTGSCALNGADAGAYTINSGASYSVLQGAAANTVTVQCNTTTAGTYNTATLDCTSTAGGNGTYPLNCTVATPQPTYSSNPAPGATINLGTAFAGSGDLTTSLEISNTGDAGSTLNSGNCALTGTNAGSFSIGANLSGPAAIAVTSPVSETITCSDPGLGMSSGLMTATLSCDNDDGGTDPQTYSLQCTYNEPGQAQYASTPADGSTIEMTPTPLLAGSASPTTSIVISNSAPGATDNDLGITGCTYAGDTEISVTSTDPLTTTLAPQGAATATVDLSCNTAVVGNYTGTYSCPFSTDGVMGAEGTASYTVNCDIRAAESAGNPADGSNLASNITAPPGSSTTNTVVTFSETNNEALDITDLSCSLATNTNFAIVSPAFAATIPAGGSIGVQVSFTDPAAPGPYTDTMTCTYTDSAGAATVIVDLTGAVRALVIPTMTTVGYVAMVFGLLLVGFFGFRRKA